MADISRSPLGKNAAEPEPIDYRRACRLPLYSTGACGKKHRHGPAIEFSPMSDVVRLEYRNVTMRFVEGTGKSLTAVERVSLSVARRRGRLADRPERLRQIHAAQHRLGALCAERGRGLRRRRARRRPQRACRLHAAEGLVIALAHHRRERAVRRRNPRLAACPNGSSAPRRCSKRSTSANFPATIRINCRAACASASRSPARWRSILRCCCSTSRSPRSTRRPALFCNANWRKRSSAPARPRC